MKADYGWIIFGVIGILLLVFWGQITSSISAFENRNFDQDAFDRGQAIFNDKHAWTPLEDKSCAMCHSADYKEEGVQITMEDYKQAPIVLENLSRKYKNDMLTNKDALYEQVMECMTNQDRMGLRRASEKAQEIKDLLAYLRAL